MDSDLVQALAQRIEELTFVHQQLTALKTDAALRDAYIVDLQQRLDDARRRIADLQRELHN